MKYIRTILAALLLAAPAQAQTLKSLMFNTTNGQVVANTGTNVLTFTNNVKFDNGDIQFVGTQILGNGLYIDFDDGAVGGGPITLDTNSSIAFQGAAAAATRTNLGLGATNDVAFNKVTVGSASITFGETSEGGIALGGQGSPNIVTIQSGGMSLNLSNYGYGFGTNNPQGAGITRTNLGLGATNIVTFAGLNNNGDITINQTTTNNGLLYIRRTNNEPFLGLANLMASNNTTVSNETLFRVGVAEATNRSAQFGFRSTNTNGNGVAVFSVFGYNALMMIGPSDPNAGTKPIQATVYSINPTNKVMTLITTNTGAMQMHRPIGIDTAGVSTNAPANTTNVAGWIQFYVGTNSVRVPYYQ